MSRYFSQLVRLAEMRRALPAAAIERNGVINSTHRARLQDVLHLVPDDAAKIIHIDAPYVYPGNTDGRYYSGSARSQLCEDAERAAAIELVRDLLREWQPKLAPGGVLLLWQASGPLLPQIIEAVHQYHWRLAGPVIWDKSRPQPGDFGAPYSRQTEMLWVLSRPGDDLVNHDGSSRSDILRFPPVDFPSAAPKQNHCFEKPVQMCEFLICKHSHKGELVLDLCGCTGSMSLAAIETGRNWMYVALSRPSDSLHFTRRAFPGDGETACCGI